jgi:myo-inositol-1(or 4)-monophosphatase
MNSAPVDQERTENLVDGDALLDLAIRAASSGAALVAEAQHRPRTIATKSSDTDFVTEMDRASEALIVAMIRAERPNDGLVGEEGTSVEGTTGVTWLIDPIDGTTSYVYGHPMFSVSVGAVVDGVTVAGAVVIPRLGETFSARRGGGAFCNDQPIFVRAQSDLQRCLVGTGFSYSADRRAHQARQLLSLITNIADIRRDGSAAAELCFVACGRLDAFYEDGLGDWDVCAGSLIVAEAGGVVSRLPIDNGVYVAANQSIHDQLSALLLKTGIPFPG